MAAIVLNELVTLPFGLNLFVGVVAFKVPYLEIAISMLTFIGIALFALLLITYVPGLVTWLPAAVGL